MRRAHRRPPAVSKLTSLLLAAACLVADSHAAGAVPPAASARAEPPAAPESVLARDTPNDGGGSLTIEWKPSLDDGGGRKSVVGYEVLRAVSPQGPFQSIGFASAGQTAYRDPAVRDGERNWYRVVAVTEAGGRGESAPAGPAVSGPQWFNFDRMNVLVITGLLFAAILYYIERGRRGRPPFVRRIAGLDALEEAIGRATEMGRPILFSPGTQEMNDAQTVAAITILAHVARKAATYDTTLKVPNRFSLVMTTARETVKEAYLAAGRPDSYREEDIFYISDEQFGYVAGVSGMIVRERPATCLYLGSFYAESLVLAETGNSIGAIQIAGTAQPAQLPFFVAACDYTLIGEELFAASAYLSGEPRQLGSLKGQDIGKLLAFAGMGAGTLLFTLAEVTRSPLLASAANGLRSLFLNR